MRRTPRSVATAVLTLFLAAAAVGCGVDPGSELGLVDGPGTTAGPGAATTVPGGDEPLDSVGDLPDLVTGGAAVSVRSCAVDPGDPERVLVEAVVVNTTSGLQLLQGVPLTVTDEDGTVVSGDDEDLWSSVTISPGRRTLLREAVDVDRAVGDVRCDVGEPDLRDASPWSGRPLDGGQVELTGCSPVAATVPNPTDEPVAVHLTVEVFDAAGFSAGTFELGQTPTTYTDGREPGPDEVALEPGAVGEYEVSAEDRVTEWGTPLDGPVAACQVVAATYVTNPGTAEVIVD